MKKLSKFISNFLGNKNTFIYSSDNISVEQLSENGEHLDFEEFNFFFNLSKKNTNFYFISEFPLRENIFNKLKIDESFYLYGFSLPNGKNFIVIINLNVKTLRNSTKLKLRNACETVEEVARNQYNIEQPNNISHNFYLPFFIYDNLKSEFSFATDSFKLLFGLQSNSWLDNRLTIFRRIFPEYFPKLKHFFKRIINCKEAYIDLKIKDGLGEERYMRLFASPNDNNCKSFIGLLIDITNEINLKNRLENSNYKFKTLLEISNNFIFSLNRSGYFMLINDDGAKQLGYKTENLIGKHFLEIVAEEDKSTVAIAFQKIIKSTSAITFDVKILNAIYEEIPFKITATSLKSENEITGVIGYGRNNKEIFDCNKKLKVIDEKRLETERLLELERARSEKKILELEKLNNAKNEFISNISHELRTPLTSIIGFAETLTEDSSLSREMLLDYSKIILDEGKRLTLLVDNILDLTKLEEGEVSLNLEKIDLADLLKILLENFHSQASDKNITIQTIIPNAEFIISADIKKLEKAFSNILSNAIKFTKRNGKITIKLNNFLNEIAVIIKDTGIGIPKEHLKNLFKKFQKFNKPGLHIPGAGLGLAITKRIIDLHNGSIHINSEENIGTTVTVILPKKRGN